MALDLAHSMTGAAGAVLHARAHGHRDHPDRQPLFELVYGRKARETGELGALEEGFAAEAA